MERDIKISALSYSNTYPFVYGLQQKLGNRAGELRFEVPAVSARRFASGEVDVALVPVGALPSLSDYKIITDYCIGSDGEVKTVCLYSKQPLEKITTVFLDIESRTSVNLAKILAREYWKISPGWKPFDSKANPVSHDSVVLIGDKTFGMENRYPFVWDLSDEWKKLTGLPFVFAVWVARKDVDNEFVEMLNDALAFGVDNIANLYDNFLIKMPRDEFEDYLKNYISYNLNDEKLRAMKKYLDYLSMLEK